MTDEIISNYIKEIKETEENYINLQSEILPQNVEINNINNDIEKKEEIKNNITVDDRNIDIEKLKPSNLNIKKQNNPNKGNSVFVRIILAQIRKQIEYYFSDKNYYHDAFLLGKASENQENCKRNN